MLHCKVELLCFEREELEQRWQPEEICETSKIHEVKDHNTAERQTKELKVRESERRQLKPQKADKNYSVFQRPIPLWLVGQTQTIGSKASVPHKEHWPMQKIVGKKFARKPASGGLYACTECKGSFHNQAALQRHLYNIHRASETMPYLCDRCSRGFLHRSSYMRHLRQHEGIFNFTCQVCHKGFHNKSDLKGHLVSHGGEHQFICPQCGKDFAYKQGLHLHMRSAHNQ